MTATGRTVPSEFALRNVGYVTESGRNGRRREAVSRDPAWDVDRGMGYLTVADFCFAFKNDMRT